MKVFVDIKKPATLKSDWSHSVSPMSQISNKLSDDLFEIQLTSAMMLLKKHLQGDIKLSFFRGRLLIRS